MEAQKIPAPQKEKLRVARKDWECTSCNAKIAKGSLYVSIGWYYQSECIRCTESAMEMHKELGTNLNDDQYLVYQVLEAIQTA